MKWTITEYQEWINNGMPINTQVLKLDLSFNKFTLPKSIGKSTTLIGSLTQLTTLNLSNNNLTTLPESIGNLTQLTELYLDNNQLTTLPESFGNLTQLTKLDLDNNQLTTLPESIGNITELTSLYLEYNNLTTLPESIGNITQLNQLDLSNNNLTTLPESIKNLTQLQDYSKKTLTIIKNEIENKLKLIKDKHKLYFHNYIFEELIAKSMHPSRMSQFIEYDCDYDYDSN